MIFCLLAMPCKGGFYLGGEIGMVFSQFIPDQNKKNTVGDYHTSMNLFTGYGVVSGGKYLGGRIKFIGLDFGSPGEVYATHVFSNAECVFGIYLTPSNLFFIAPGLEISSNSHKDNKGWNFDYGWVLNVGSRTLITGHFFWQIEGTFLYHPNVLKTASTTRHDKNALRFYVGCGYNF